MLANLPNILSLSRILVIPALVAAFYLPGDMANWTVFALFALAGITDYLDGYFARTHQTASRLGQFLDPVADKLLVAAALLMLVAVDRITGWAILPTLVILCREILVAGLREFLAEVRVVVPVSRLAKWKTAVQILAIGFLLVGDAAPGWIPALDIGIYALWLAALLTIYTGYDYLRGGLIHMTGENPPAAPEPSDTAQRLDRAHDKDAVTRSG
jgi:cardiolipin synthase